MDIECRQIIVGALLGTVLLVISPTQTCKQIRQMLFELIAASFLEFLEESGCPRGVGHLIRIVEESVRVGGVCALKGLLNMAKIIRHRTAVEVVDDQAFTAGCCALYLHHAVANVDGNDAPLVLLLSALGGLPRQAAVADEWGHIDGTCRPVDHHFRQTGVLTVFLRHQ